MKKIGEEIDITLSTIKQNLTILSQEDEKIFPALLEKYRETGDISQALFLRDSLYKQEEERQILREKMAQQKAIDSEHDLFTPAEEIINNSPDEIIPQEIPEYSSVPLTNETWEKPKFVKEILKEAEDPAVKKEENLDKPVLAYTCDKDKMRVNLEYSVTGEVAIIRYIKQMAEYYGAEFNVIKKPQLVKGE